MARCIGEFTVKDYAQFERNLANFFDHMKEYGCREWKIYRNTEDPNEVVMISYWNSREEAEKHLKSARVQDAIENSTNLTSPLVVTFDDIDNELVSVKANNSM